MMPLYWMIACLAGAYLLGSIPTSVWIGRYFFGIDVRTQGSGNAGATNTFRTLGKKAGIAVFIIDIAKGVLPVLWVRLVDFGYMIPDYLPVAMAFTAAIGHIYPVYVGFKGGKGVATLTGAVFALDYRVGLICIAAFIVTFLIRRMVSLSSLAAAAIFPIAYFSIHQPYNFIESLLIALLPVLLFYTHRSNIRRIIKGQEPRFSLKSNKK